MKVSAFNVLLLHRDNGSIDITDMVLNVNITESLFGDLEGSIEVVDGVGLLDNNITNQNNIIIEFEYLKNKVQQKFYLDGVSSVDATTNLTKKTYVINLKSINSLMDSMQLIAKSFKGKSSDIIKTIFDESFKSDLKILSDSITKGSYIAPNISPSKAIKQIKSQAYDVNQNPFFLFQRLVDNKYDFLTSLSQIEKQTVSATINPVIQNSETVSKSLSNIGQPSNVVIHGYSDNQVYKTNNGVFGKNIVNTDISNSTITNEPYGASINATSKTNILRTDMYDNSEPLLNNNDYINKCKMQTILNLLFDTRVTAYDCHAIPNIGVGNKIELLLQKNKQSQGISGKFSGDYLISKIVHRIADNEYTQNIEMVRG